MNVGFVILALVYLISSTSTYAQQTWPKSAVCTKLPPVGTKIINTYFVLDSNGVNVTDTVPDGKIADDEQDVLQSGITLYGRSNVVTYFGPGHEDTTYLSYAPDGDVYLLNTRRVGHDWERLPFGMKPGKVIKSKPKLDTGSIMGEHYAMLNSTSTKVLGWDTLTVAGAVTPVVRLQILSISATDKSMLNKMPYTEFINASNYWYAPSLGYFARIEFGWGGRYFLNQQVKSISPPAAKTD